MEELSWSEARDLFRTWRENNTRKSNEVIYHWQAVLSSKLNKLENEKYMVLEQVCIAALDCYRLEIAKDCIKQLSAAFPGSQRVKMYKAMELEAHGRYNDATNLLMEIIEHDPSNSMPKKRLIAIYKAEGRNVEAIKGLTEYLKTFMADAEAWQELSELYLAENDFSKAAFCVEELILHNPHNHLLHQRYADIKYTQGGLDNMEIARSYYCQALKLNPKNLRALYGLYLASSNIAVSHKTPQKKKDALKLAEITLGKIKKHYEEKNSNDIGDRLSALQLN